jgi:hypothetical protein
MRVLVFACVLACASAGLLNMFSAPFYQVRCYRPHVFATFSLDPIIFGYSIQRLGISGYASTKDIRRA